MPLYGPPPVATTTVSYRDLGSNLLRYTAADPTGVLDSATVANALVDQLLAAGHRQPLITIPQGAYKCLSQVDFEGCVSEGESMEGTQFSFPNDLGKGVQGMTYQKTQIATSAKCGPLRMWVRGPSLVNTLGVYPSQMDGVRIGNAAYGEGCLISGFRVALDFFKDHECAAHMRLGGGIGMYFNYTQSGGDQGFYDISTSGCVVAGLACHPDDNLGGVDFTKCHYNFGPVSLWKFDLGDGSPGTDHTVHFTADMTAGSAVLTNVTYVYGALSATGYGVGQNPKQRVMAANGGLPPSTSSSVETIVDGVNLDGANTLRLNKPATANATGIHCYSARFQYEFLSALEFTSSSFESWANALLLGDSTNSTTCIGLKFINCLCSNPGDIGGRMAGVPTAASIYRVSTPFMVMVESEQVLKVMDNAAMELLGNSIQMNLGEMNVTIDAAEAAGKLFIKSSASSVSGRGLYKDATTFKISSPAGSTPVVRNDAIQRLDSRLELAATSGTVRPGFGVALARQIATTDFIPIAVSGPVTFRLASTTPGTILKEKYVKPDAANPGRMVQAASRYDGEVYGCTTADNSGGTVTGVLTGLI